MSDPTTPATPWEPSDPTRWAHLNLVDPNPSGELPEGALVADALAWALVPAGAADPVEGIVAAVRAELGGLAELASEAPAHVALAGILRLLGRRLEAAMLLLRWTDNRERMPVEEPEVEEEGDQVQPAPESEQGPSSGTRSPP